jgi:transcriptional regulator with GAF, ATPase, and Fis domain
MRDEYRPPENFFGNTWSEPVSHAELEIEGDSLLHLQHRQDLDVLAAIAAKAAEQTRPQQLLRFVLEILERGLGMVRGTIMLLQPDGKELVVEAAQDISEWQARDAQYPMGDGVIGGVVEGGQPAVVPRISDEPRFLNHIHHRDEEHFAETSFLCVPIRSDNEVVGTLSVDLPAQSPELLRERLRVLEIIASMIAYDARLRREHRRLPEKADSVRANILAMRVAVLERDLIVDALKATEGNLNAAARQLGTTARIVRYKVKKLGIDIQQLN